MLGSRQVGCVKRQTREQQRATAEQNSITGSFRENEGKQNNSKRLIQNRLQYLDPKERQKITWKDQVDVNLKQILTANRRSYHAWSGEMS